MNLPALQHPATTLPAEPDGFRVEIDAARERPRRHAERGPCPVSYTHLP